MIYMVLCIICFPLSLIHGYQFVLFHFVHILVLSAEKEMTIFCVPYTPYSLSVVTMTAKSSQILCVCTCVLLLYMKFEHAYDKTSKITCAPSEDSDQPGRMPSLIRVFAVRMNKPWVLSYPLSVQRRLIRLGGCPGWADAQADLSLRWVHKSICWFCHVVSHFLSRSVHEKDRSMAVGLLSFLMSLLGKFYL